MKRGILLTTMSVFLLALAATAFAGDEGHSGDMHEGMHGDADAPKVFDSEQEVGTKATCPVTGNVFAIDEDTQHSEVDGKHVYFCCPACKPQFDENPDKFLKKK